MTGWRGPGVRELAAVWCSILAGDRAQSAWTFKIYLSEHPAGLKPKGSHLFDSTEAGKVAWAAFNAARVRVNGMWNTAETWGEAEAMLRTGWAP